VRIRLKKYQSEFPQGPFQKPNLTSLEIFGDSIDNIPAEIKELKYLKTLSISTKALKVFPNCLFEIPSLKILKLKNGILESFSSEPPRRCQIVNLQLTNNLIAEIPHWFGDLNSLKELDLAGNNLQELPLQFAKLKALNRLNLDRNQLQEVYHCLQYLPNLNHLSLDNNPLTAADKKLLTKELNLWFT